MKKDVRAEDLRSELYGVGAMLGTFACVYAEDCGCLPCEEELASAIYGLQEHVYRLCDDWMEYVKNLEKEIETLKAARK